MPIAQAPPRLDRPVVHDSGRLKYRADIDGLRALAVVAVIFYHAKVPGFSGGYLGVDIFFVISGFLITQVLDAPAAKSRTAVLTKFYLRRSRRLLPALFVMLAVCAAVAVALDLPSDLRAFGRSLTLAVAFLGNVAAALNGGYFDPGERFTPLRHLWSIGVEEQFYVFYPLCLFVLAGFRKIPRGGPLAALAVASLVLSFLAAGRWPVQNYFMLPTRAWELLVGGVLAVSPGAFRGSRRTKQALAAIGMAGVLSAFWYARVIRFPGLATIVVSASAALLLVGNTGGSTVVGRALSVRPVVFTGRVSYSLYLWHAPILAMFSYYNVFEPSDVELCLLLAAIYLVAVGSWAVIEQPFRSGALVASPSLFVPATLVAGAALAAVGLWLMRTAGLPFAARPTPVAESSGRADGPPINAACFNIASERIAAGLLCSFGPQDESAKRVLVWGDSHANALLPVYRSLAASDGIRIYFGVQGACWPLVGSEVASSGEFWRARCAKFNEAMVQAVRRLNPERVILNAYWLDPGVPTELEHRRQTPRAGPDAIDGMRRTLDDVRAPGRSVCAVLTVPGYPYPIPYALAMAARRHINVEKLALTRSEAIRQYQTVEDELRMLARDNQLRVVDPQDVLCPVAGCSIQAADGVLLYEDANHLSSAGARLLTGALEQCVSDLH